MLRSVGQNTSGTAKVMTRNSHGRGTACVHSPADGTDSFLPAVGQQDPPLLLTKEGLVKINSLWLVLSNQHRVEENIQQSFLKARGWFEAARHLLRIFFVANPRPSAMGAFQQSSGPCLADVRRQGLPYVAMRLDVNNFDLESAKVPSHGLLRRKTRGRVADTCCRINRTSSKK